MFKRETEEREIEKLKLQMQIKEMAPDMQPSRLILYLRVYALNFKNSTKTRMIWMHFKNASNVLQKVSYVQRLSGQ